MDALASPRTAFETDVEDRFGVLPNFFCSAPDAPELVQQLWIYAKAAYLDNPLPSLFKERLFVYLSRFCEIRYCIVRHVGFLAGRGRPAGDSTAVPHDVEQVLRLLQRRVPGREAIQPLIASLAALSQPLPAWPEPETELEGLLLDAATLLFLEPARCEPVQRALRGVTGQRTFEHLVGFLSFIRTAHYWTLMHPDLELEDDVRALMEDHDRLAQLLLHDPQAARCEMGERLFEELTTLRELVDLRAELHEREQANHRLEELHRHKDSFIAMVGHELRNPISAISTAAGILGALPIENAHVANVCGILTRQTAAVGRMLDDLQDASRLSLDKLTIQCEPLDLREVVRESVSDHLHLLEAAGLAVLLEVADGPLPVLGDRVRMAQIIENLLSNALRFTAGPGRVCVRVAASGAGGVVEVSDSGAGFDLALGKILFTAFVQGTQELARERGGLGLGLAISRRVAELHGGTVTGASAGLGQGAVFTWTIPLDPRQLPVRAASPTDAARSLDVKRVLIVEDNQDVAQGLERLLQLAGYDVLVAHNGNSGLDLVRRWHPDVVLCDLGLPGGMDGFAFAEACRRDPNLGVTRLIAISGYCAAADVERACGAGFEQLVAKPIDLHRIRSALHAGPLQ